MIWPTLILFISLCICGLSNLGLTNKGYEGILVYLTILIICAAFWIAAYKLIEVLFF